jgi:enamine deaminase RidA (YjgF/YER057c/UK114 family)
MSFFSMDNNKLVSRSWNGTPISRRTTDGFVNATAMCRANGKEWKHYFETDRCHKYLDALEGSVGITTDRLFTSITTGPNDGRGTWVHPQVAVDLARWISAPFAVWMDGWFLESVQGAPAPAVVDAPRLGAAEVVALVERSVALFEKLGGMDQRDELLFKDIVRSNVLSASSGSVPALVGEDELTLSDAWMEVFQEVLPRTKYRSAGILVANAYREDFGEEPPTRQQFVDGAPRQVKSYRRTWLVETLRRFKSQLAGA